MLARLTAPEPFPDNIAIVSDGRAYTYQTLRTVAHQRATWLLNGAADLAEARVAFLVEPGFDYVATQWAIWLAGGMAVPLCTTHPPPSLRYVVADTAADTLIVSAVYESRLAELAAERTCRLLVLGRDEPTETGTMPTLTPSRRAMILYTSGTTNQPKGVVSTHATIDAQVRSLVDAWHYSPADCQLCVLPLHHVHGIINVVSCTLWASGTVEFQPAFSAEAVFDWLQKTANSPAQGVFMAVPTIYYKLIAHYDALPTGQQHALTAALRRFRLMVSGSAALPQSVMERWETLSGHRLLERYGMTEIGMAISNPYAGERRAGHIGQPLPGVQVRLVDEQDEAIGPGEPGEIQVKGPTVFGEYWQKPAATTDSFTPDGWFRTGDIAQIDGGYYRILGRNSVDIIKSGGYKISALEIEEVLRTYPGIRDTSVVGLPNEEWGEIVGAALVTNGDPLDLEQLNGWLRDQLPAYKVPRRYRLVADLPRNAMGKVTKNDLKPLFT